MKKMREEIKREMDGEMREKIEMKRRKRVRQRK
jgi:hypothetical protein